MMSDVVGNPDDVAPVKLGSKVARIFRGVISAVLTPRPKKKMWEWLDENVVVPDIAGSPFPGPLNSGRMPLWRGLLEKLEQRHVRFFNLCKSARTGGSLFFGICPLLHKIATKPGPILWLEPTRKTASRLSRQEIQPFIRACKPVDALRIRTKKAWTTLEMIFKTCTFGILGAGSNSELGGRQGEMIVVNEKDKIPAKARAEAPPGLLVLVRSKLFRRTRKIISNSTPTLESAETWGDFLAGSQLYPYLPCPACGAYQRLTFFQEPPEPDKWIRVDDDDPILGKPGRRHGVPFAADTQIGEDREIKRAPDGRGWLVKGIPQTGRVWWPEKLHDKKAKTFDVDGIEREARYECAFCEEKIDFGKKLNWMNARYCLRAHNPNAPADTESAHVWAAYSPMDLGIGGLAKKYVLALGNIARMHDCANSDWGKYFERTPTRITKKIIELIQEHSPRYDRQYPLDLEEKPNLPARPCFIFMTADVQQTEFWYETWMIDVEGTMYLLAWGSVVSYPELVDISNRAWEYDFADGTPVEQHTVWKGIMDSGYKAKRGSSVYRFVHEQGGRWIASKGGHLHAGKEKPIHETTINFNYDGAQVSIPFIHYNDDQQSEHLYRFVIKERQHKRCLPVKLDEHFIEQVTSAHLAAKRLPDGRTSYEWQYGCDPHLGDCWKLAEIFHFIFNPAILQKVRAMQDSSRAAMLEKLKAQ